MDHRDTFSGCHPAVNFLYFALVLVFTMVFLHPVSLVLSLGTALLYLVALKGTSTVKQGMKVLIPMMLMAAILNPAFNHEGVTILTCGTCASFYGLEGKLAVGSVTNMYDLTETLLAAGKVIRL